MSAWSLYSVATGRLLGRTWDGQAADVEANIPAGTGLVAGVHDHLCRIVNLKTGDVEPWEPPAPAADALRTWEWDAAAERWQAVPTLAAIKADRWDAIKQKRAAVEFAGFEWDGSVFDSDDASRLLILVAVMSAAAALQAGEPFSKAWTLADNSVRILTGKEMVQVGRALDAHIEAQRAIGKQLRDQVADAAAASAVGAVTWPVTSQSSKKP